MPEYITPDDVEKAYDAALAAEESVAHTHQDNRHVPTVAELWQEFERLRDALNDQEEHFDIRNEVEAQG